MKKLNCIGLVVILVIMTGCGGMFKDPIQPTAMYKPTDSNMTCEYLIEEFYEIEKERDHVMNLKSKKTGGNVASGLVGMLIFWPMLFAMDISNDEEVALLSIDDRIKYLKKEATIHGCDIPNIQTYAEIKGTKKEVLDDPMHNRQN